VLWGSLFAAAGWLAGRSALARGSGTSIFAVAATGLLVWLWAAQGFYAGIPLDALTWLVFGVAALGGNGPEVERRSLPG